MKVSSTYVSHNDGFSDIDPNAISQKYSIYMIANIKEKLWLCQYNWMDASQGL